MDPLLLEILKSPFLWGLVAGLAVAFFIWKGAFTARRQAAREIKRLEGELRELQGHLNTQLKINASGNEALMADLNNLREQNENLRVNLAALQQKPGRTEQRQLQVQEIAIRRMREQAPGFAAAWESALREGEAELQAADSGLVKLMRRVLPGIGNSQQSGGSSGQDPAGNL
jgi:hypothetical protein